MITKGKSISIFSTKGGTGKSTTALNIAGVFSRLEKKVLIIDLDTTSCAIGTYLNKVSNKNICSFNDDYINHTLSDIDYYVTKYNDNIDFIAGSNDPRMASKIIPSVIPIIIEKALYAYDFVLIDMNHVLNEFNLTILDNTDVNLLVLSNDLIDLKNMCNLIHVFNDIDKHNYKVLLNGAISSNKRYYSLYDIKNIIKTNIDYFIEPGFYLKTMDTYVSDGKILTLEEKMPKSYPSVYKTYMTLCKDLMEEEDEK